MSKDVDINARRIADKYEALPHKTHNQERLFNAPDLHAKEFLLAVMHDPHMNISVRMDAACKLLDLYPFEYQYTPAHTHIIIPPLLLNQSQEGNA